jgi:hypothetical protein
MKDSFKNAQGISVLQWAKSDSIRQILARYEAKYSPKSMKYLFAIAAVLSLPLAALAQSERVQEASAGTFLETLFFALLPVLLIGAFIWLFVMKGMRGMQKKNFEHVEEQKRHNEVVEKSLERIAKALEKRNGDAG